MLRWLENASVIFVYIGYNNIRGSENVEWTQIILLSYNKNYSWKSFFTNSKNSEF